MARSPRNATQLITDWNQGDPEALPQLIPLVYEELRRLAHGYLRRERPNHTLQATALVHEAYMRLAAQTQVQWENRARLLGMAAEMMRRILVDYARRHKAAKRGGAEPELTLEAADLAGERTVDLEALDEALTRLAAIDARQSRIVELRFFGGLSIEETAAVLEVSPTTVKYEWRMARAWFLHELCKRGSA